MIPVGHKTILKLEQKIIGEEPEEQSFPTLFGGNRQQAGCRGTRSNGVGHQSLFIPQECIARRSDVENLIKIAFACVAVKLTMHHEEIQGAAQLFENLCFEQLHDFIQD